METIEIGVRLQNKLKRLQFNGISQALRFARDNSLQHRRFSTLSKTELEFMQQLISQTI